jgi:hypothetical protein
MATTIVTKYGSGAPADTDLVRGELAVDTENGRLYTETSGGAVIEIGRNPSGNVDVTGSATFTGTASGATASSVGNKVVIDDAENGISILSSTSGAGYLIFGDSDDNDIGMLIYDHSANALRTYVNGAERVTISSAGNVGIGTSSPTSLGGGAKLTVNQAADGNIVFARGGSTRQVQLGTTSTTGYINADNTSGGLTFNVNASEVMRISSGSVGIGVTPKTTNATVTGSLNVNQAGLLVRNSNQAYFASNIYWDASDQLKSHGAGYGLASLFIPSDGSHRFFNTTAAATGADENLTLNETMRIDSSGNVGIGVADGDVTGDGTAARTYVGIIGTANRGRLNLGTTASNGADSGYLGFTNGTNDLGSIVMDTTPGVQNTGTMYVNSTRSIKIQSAASDEAVFNETGVDTDFRVESDNNANMLFVDAGNNRVGIGTGTPGYLLDVLETNTGGVADFRLRNAASSNAASGARNIIQVANGNVGDPRLVLSIEGVQEYAIGIDNSDSDILKFNNGSDPSASTNYFSIGAGAGGVVVNDGSADIDFRVESDGNANMLVVDASANNVSVGASTTVATLGITSSVDGTEAAPHFSILGAASSYRINMWLDGTAAYIGQNSTLRALRLYSGAETAGVALTNGATSWSTFSDERLKENVEPVENALQSLSGLRTVKYHLKDVDGPEDKKKIGVIAQDLVGVLDEVIDPTFRPDDGTEYMGVRYTELVPVLIKAIQEQQELIKALEARITALES